MADESDDTPLGQNNFGLAYNPLLPMGDPMAYARTTGLPSGSPSVQAAMQPGGSIRVPMGQPNPIMRPEALPNVPELPKRGSGGAPNELQAAAAAPMDSGANQLGGLSMLTQLQGLHDMVRQSQGTAAPQTAPAAAMASPESVAASAAPYWNMVSAAATKYGVDPALLSRQLYAESGFDPKAKSPAGAKGIGQFMPATAKQYGVDVDDPASSIDGAAHYMSDLTKKYGGNTQLALMAYNMGPAATDKWLQGKWQAPQETHDYVKKITGKDITPPNVPGANATAMEASTPSSGQFAIPPAGATFRGLPDRSVFNQGRVMQGSVYPSGQDTGPFDDMIGRQLGINAIKATQAPNKEQNQQQQQQPAAPQSELLNLNGMTPQMQNLYKYMMLRMLLPQIQFKNVGYDPWRVHDFGIRGGY